MDGIYHMVKCYKHLVAINKKICLLKKKKNPNAGIVQKKKLTGLFIFFIIKLRCFFFSV